jgi:hypothetical protein
MIAITRILLKVATESAHSLTEGDNSAGSVSLVHEEPEVSVPASMSALEFSFSDSIFSLANLMLRLIR